MIISKISLFWVKNQVLIALFTLVTIVSFGQDEPFYKVPNTRKHPSEIVNFPNLKSKSNYYYIGVLGGVSKFGTSDKTIADYPLITNHSFSGFWGAQIGKCFNNDYWAEIGFEKFDVDLRTVFQNIYSSQGNLYLLNLNKFTNIQARLKKRVVYFNNISKASYFNLGMALGYNLGAKNYQADEFNYVFNPLVGTNTTNLKVIQTQMSSIKTTPNLELMAEIKGKLTERIEIGVFVKSIYMFNSLLKNQVNLTLNNNAIFVANNFIFNNLWFSGLQIQWNSPKVIKYSKIEK